MAIGEVLVSATGLDFSYSQSPKYLKSVVMSAWFVTVAIGNMLVSAIALIPINDRAMEFFLYAALMLFFVVIFYILVHDYKYREQELDLEANEDDDEDQKEREKEPLIKEEKKE